MTAAARNARFPRKIVALGHFWSGQKPSGNDRYRPDEAHDSVAGFAPDSVHDENHCRYGDERHDQTNSDSLALAHLSLPQAELAAKHYPIARAREPPERRTLHKWMMAFYLMCASKKGVSAHQLHRALGLTYQSAWFMAHRIREAMRDGGFSPLGGAGEIVEADETYYGNRDEPHVSPQRRGRPFTKKGKGANKRAIVALVERGGNVRTFHVAVADKVTVTKIVTDNIARESRLHTDEGKLYFGADEHFSAHKSVKHSAKEYARKEYTFDADGETFTTETVHTNSAEGYFSIFKRGMKGIYQHCGEKHLHRYLAEYDFRYNHRVALGHSDIDRTKAAIIATAGKRLTYRQPH